MPLALLPRAAADVPIENIKFDSAELEKQARTVAESVNRCDRSNSTEGIKGLKEQLKSPLYNPLDKLRLRDLIALLEREICGPNPLVVGKEWKAIGFYFRNVAEQVRDLIAAVRNKVRSIDDAIAQLENAATGLENRAKNLTAAQGRTQYEADARALRETVKWLKTLKTPAQAEAFVPAPGTDPSAPGTPGAAPATPAPGSPATPPDTTPGPTPGATPPGHGSVPGRPRGVPDDGFADALRAYDRLRAGVIGGALHIPSFRVGTEFVAGAERPIVSNDRNLNFVGGEAAGAYRIGPIGGIDNARLAIYVRGGTLWGESGATVPIGGNPVAYTFLDRNAATGVTGVNAGATGKDVRIGTNGEFLWFNARLDWEATVLQQWLGIRALRAIVGIGPIYEYSDIGHRITEQSLVFPDVSARTHLVNDNHFIGAMLRGGVKFDDGNFSAALAAYIAPGANIFDGKAEAHYLCGPCPNPGDRNFSQSRGFNDTRFAVKAGAEMNLRFRLTPSLSLNLGGFYDFTSATGYIRPPTTPSEQPVRRDFSSSHSYGGRLGVSFRF